MRNELFKIENTEVAFLDRAIKASGNPMRVEIDTSDTTDADLSRACNLGKVKVGTGHDTFLNGIRVVFDLTAPSYFWPQFQRYHFADIVSSQSKMHRIQKMNFHEVCNEYVSPVILGECNRLKQQYLDTKDKEVWYKLINSIPMGLHLGATISTNYQQLKTMYLQRNNHKLPEWKQFMEWCEELPLFLELTGLNKTKEE